MRKSDRDLGRELGRMMQLQNAAERERKSMSKTVALFVGIIIFLCIVTGFLYMLGAF